MKEYCICNRMGCQGGDDCEVLNKLQYHIDLELKKQEAKKAAAKPPLNRSFKKVKSKKL